MIPALELTLRMVDGSRDDEDPELELPLGMVNGNWDNVGPVLDVVDSLLTMSINDWLYCTVNLWK